MSMHLINTSFFLLLNTIPFMNIPLFFLSIQLLYLCCFQFGLLRNKAVVNIHVQMFLWKKMFSFQLAVEWLGLMVSICLTSWKNCQTVFQNACIILQSQQQCKKSFSCSEILPGFGFCQSIYFRHSKMCIDVFHSGVKWYLPSWLTLDISCAFWPFSYLMLQSVC